MQTLLLMYQVWLLGAWKSKLLIANFVKLNLKSWRAYRPLCYMWGQLISRLIPKGNVMGNTCIMLRRLLQSQVNAPKPLFWCQASHLEKEINRQIRSFNAKLLSLARNEPNLVYIDNNVLWLKVDRHWTICIRFTMITTFTSTNVANRAYPIKDVHYGNELDAEFDYVYMKWEHWSTM